MTWDGNVSVTVLSDPQAVTTRNFGTALHVTEDVGVTFTERTRSYTSSAEAAADSPALGAGPIAAAAIHFSQPLHTSTFKVGRKESDEAQVITWEITGVPVEDDKFKITVNGIETEYTAGAGPTVSSVGVALNALVVAALAAEDVTVSGATAFVIVTADNAGEPFTYSSLYTPVGTVDAAITETVTQANVNYATELAEILTEDSAWYGLTIQSRAKADILYTAAWMESNDRLFMAQSLDADVLTGAANNVLATLKALNYARTALAWHHSGTEYLGAAWVGYTLQADPDAVTTIWAYKPLVGVTIKDPDLTATQQGYITSQYGNCLTTFGGVTCSGMGILVDGRKLDTLVTKDWYKARLVEKYQGVLLAASTRNQKIPYTDKGLKVFVTQAESVNGQGIAVGHFAPDSTSASVPAVADVPAADKTNRIVRVTSKGVLAGAVEAVVVTASITAV